MKEEVGKKWGRGNCVQITLHKKEFLISEKENENKIVIKCLTHIGINSLVFIILLENLHI